MLRPEIDNFEKAVKKIMIKKFIKKLNWIQEDFYNEDEENRLNIVIKEYEKELK